MSNRILAVTLLVAVALAFAGNNVSTVSNPAALANPQGPKVLRTVEVPVPPPPVTDAAPPFGTVVQQWNLSMSGQYSGAGITWLRDSGRFYLIDQGAMSGVSRCYSLSPSNPTGTIRNENWTFPNLGSSTRDIPWGIAWDPDSGCFWMTNILDGSVYSGCYLLRFNKDGTWRGTAADSWRINTPLNLLWLGGMFKWVDRGRFLGTPIQSSPSAYNYVAKFNPYTKTSLGNVANGDQTSERGCAFIPYDSFYLYTCGWNANAWRNRDSNGTLLRQVSATVYGPADWEVMVPQVVIPTDTVFLFCICSDPNNTLQKISAGFTWDQFPGVNPHSVAALSILAPTGTVDSGQTVTPRLVIRNMYNGVATNVMAYFQIDDNGGTVYVDSVLRPAMAAKTTETIAFTGWVPMGRDSMFSIGSVFWSDDSNHKDDTVRNKFLVRVKDIAVDSIVRPRDTLDSGIVVTPQCHVWNYGNQTMTFDVRFRIGAWQSTRNLTLMAGGATFVNAPASWTAMPGVWLYQVLAIVVGDAHPENNLKQDTVYVRGTITTDVAAVAVLNPAGYVDTLTTFAPQGRVKNLSTTAQLFQTYFIINNPAGSPVYTESAQVMLAPGDSSDVTYASTRLTVPGVSYSVAESVYLAGDQNSTNDCKRQPLNVVPKMQGDIGAVRILVPVGTIKPDSTITPAAVWHNYHSEAVPFAAYFKLINPFTAEVYNQFVAVTLSPGIDTTVTFPPFNVGTVLGNWVAVCSTAAGDTNPANDVIRQGFRVDTTSIPPGWYEVTSFPLSPSGKAVKDGGWLAYDAGNGFVFGAKGNKTADFAYYSVGADQWTSKAVIPSGIEGKLPSKGASGASNGNGVVYATKGNNTSGFWKYDLAKDSWYQKKDVPLGVSNKKVKGGTSSAYVSSTDGAGYVYLLKGYKNEFFKYDIDGDSWKSLPDAPIGSNLKWDKGSWIVFDGGHYIYAHKAKYHEFYRFNTDGDSWGPQLTAMPIPGTAGSKKSKDGGSAAFIRNGVYAFKGGNTVEWWRYTVDGDSWREKENIPLIGSSTKKKKIKAGAAVAAFGQAALFAFKGNKCVEFWRYGIPNTDVYGPARPEGVMASVVKPVAGALRIAPNPLTGGYATVRYSLPRSGAANLRIYDVTGRTVLTQGFLAGRDGSVNVDLRKLTAGVYLVKLSGEGFAATQKLVVQH